MWGGKVRGVDCDSAETTAVCCCGGCVIYWGMLWLVGGAVIAPMLLCMCMGVLLYV